jgi:hypothetical protein
LAVYLFTPSISQKPSVGGIVFNCSDRPFFDKTPKSMPKTEETTKQFITGPPRAAPKQPEF